MEDTSSDSAHIIADYAVFYYMKTVVEENTKPDITEFIKSLYNGSLCDASIAGGAIDGNYNNYIIDSLGLLFILTYHISASKDASKQP